MLRLAMSVAFGLKMRFIVKFSPKSFAVSFLRRTFAAVNVEEVWRCRLRLAACLSVIQNVKMWNYDHIWPFLATLSAFLYVYGQLIT